MIDTMEKTKRPLELPHAVRRRLVHSVLLYHAGMFPSLFYAPAKLESYIYRQINGGQITNTIFVSFFCTFKAQASSSSSSSSCDFSSTSSYLHWSVSESQTWEVRSSPHHILSSIVGSSCVWHCECLALQCRLSPPRCACSDVLRQPRLWGWILSRRTRSMCHTIKRIFSYGQEMLSLLMCVVSLRLSLRPNEDECHPNHQ